VVPGGAVDRAGLREQDRILTVDGYPQTVWRLRRPWSRASPTMLYQ